MPGSGVLKVGPQKWQYAFDMVPEGPNGGWVGSGATWTPQVPLHMSIFTADIVKQFKITNRINPNQVITTMRELYAPLFGEFIELNRVGSWAAVSYMFFETLLLNERAYLDYDPEADAFEVYARVGREGNTFIRVNDNRTVTIPNPDLLASCTWDGAKDVNRVGRWYEVAAKWLTYRTILEEKLILAGTHVTFDMLDLDGSLVGEHVTRFKAQLMNGDPFACKTGALDVKRGTYVEYADIDIYRRAIQGWLDTELAILGLVRNRHMKAARLSISESSAATHSTKCIIQNRHDQLIHLSEQISRLWGIDLDFTTINDVEQDLSDADTTTVSPEYMNAPAK